MANNLNKNLRLRQSPLMKGLRPLLGLGLMLILSPRSAACPKALLDLVEEDSKDSIEESRKPLEKTCSPYLRQSDGYIPDQLLKIYEYKDPQLQDSAILTRLTLCTKQFPPAKADRIISKYFVSQKRLEEGSLEKLVELAGIESVLSTQNPPPKPSLDEICSQSSFSTVLATCDRYLNKCSSNQNIQDLADQTTSVLQEVEAIKVRRQQLESRIKSSSLEEAKKIQVQIKILDATIQSKAQITPWTQGQKFQRQLAKGYSMPYAILAQLRDNRHELIKEFQKLQSASRCYRGLRGSDCDPKALRRALALTPPLASRSESIASFSSKYAWQAYYEHEHYQECLTNLKIDQDQMNSLISSAKWNVGVSLVTGGFGMAKALAGGVKILKDLAQLTIGTVQADFFVREGEKLYAQCLHKISGLEQAMTPVETTMQCPQASQNISRARELDSCYQQAAMTLMSFLPLAQMKNQFAARGLPHSRSPGPVANLENWAPKNSEELGTYFAGHVREVNENGIKLFQNFKKHFVAISKKDIKAVLAEHDMEKFESFEILSQRYAYKGIPKEMIEGLTDSKAVAKALSRDGQYYEVSILDGLKFLWGNSKEDLPTKIRLAKTATEKIHLEAVLKIRNYLVPIMDEIDHKIMASVIKNYSAVARSEILFFDMMSDLAARNANPLTRLEFARPIENTVDFLNRMGPSWIIKKISASGSVEDKQAAINLVKRIGMPEIAKMSRYLEGAYKGAGVPVNIGNFLRKQNIKEMSRKPD